MLEHNRKPEDLEYHGLIIGRILIRRHVLKQGCHKKNVETSAKKVVVGVECLLQVLLKSLNVKGFLYILLKDVLGLVRV